MATAATAAFTVRTFAICFFFRLSCRSVILIEMRTFAVLAHTQTHKRTHRNLIICLLTLSEIKLNNSFCFGQHFVPLFSPVQHNV